MSKQIRRIRQNLDKQLDSLAFHGFLAKLGNRTKQVSTGVADQVYVTTFEGQVIKVRNRRVPNNAGEIVIVGTDQYSGGKVEVLSLYNIQRSTSDGTTPATFLVPPHSHNYYTSPNSVTWVEDAQVMPINVLPYLGSTTVRVYPGLMRKSAAPGWVAIPSQDVALLAAIPSSGALWVTLQGNDNGTVDYVMGSPAADRASLTAADIPESTTGRPLMHIVLEADRTTLYRNKYVNDFLDPRFATGAHAEGVVHNKLYGLQGGSQAIDEFFHLTGSQHVALVGGSTTYADAYHTHNIAGSGGGATTFLALTDTPSAYTGSGGWILAVKQTADGVTFLELLDEDDMASDSALLPASQQSIKAYVDALSFGGGLHIDQSGGTSDTYGVLSGTINGSNTTFTVSEGEYISGSLVVLLNGQTQTQGSSEDWVETTPASGTFDFNTAPVSGDEITVMYSIFTDGLGDADTVDGQHASDFDYALISGNDAGTNVTASELESLSDGSNADSLHVHSTTGLSNVTSGTYTPSGTAVLNVDALTTYQCTYIRVGNIVTVAGKIDIDATAASTAKVRITLPVSSNLANNYDLSGTITNVFEPTSGYILADTTNNEAQIEINPSGTINQGFRFVFMYEVL